MADKSNVKVAAKKVVSLWNAKKDIKFRFTCSRDIALLQIAIQINPWQLGPEKWKDVSDKMTNKYGQNICIRTIRDRIKLLLQKFESNQLKRLDDDSDKEENKRIKLIETIIRILEAENEHVTILAEPEILIEELSEHEQENKIEQEFEIPCAMVTPKEKRNSSIRNLEPAAEELKMEVSAGEVLEISWPKHREHLYEEIGRLFESQVESDIEFVLNSDRNSDFVQSLKSHSLILKLFCQTMRDFASPQFCFEDEGIESQDVRCLLEFVYRGTTQVKAERLNAVKKAGQKLGFGVLVELLDVVYQRPKRQVHVTRITKRDEDFELEGNFEDDGADISMTIRPTGIINSRKEIGSTDTIADQDIEVLACGSSSSSFKNLEMAKQKQILNSNKEINSCSSKEMKCNVCDKRFKNEIIFSHHIKLHKTYRTHPGCKFQCNVNGCSGSCSSYVNLLRHKRRVHAMKIKLTCDLCGAIYRSENSLNKHLQDHLSGKFICKICGLNMSKISNMGAHMRTHELVKRFKCPLQCEYKCREKFALKPHLWRVHKLAGAEADAVVAKVTEINEVDEKELLNQEKCSVCGRYFLKKSMQRHMRGHTLNETGGKKFKCLVRGCSVANQFLCGLKNHLKTKHKLTPDFIEKIVNGNNSVLQWNLDNSDLKEPAKRFDLSKSRVIQS